MSKKKKKFDNVPIQKINVLNESEEMQVDDSLFKPLNNKEDYSNVHAGESVGYWKDVWSRLKSNKVTIAAIIIIVVIISLAIFVPAFSRYTYEQTDFANPNALPSAEHLFGTDQLGRDMLVRVMMGVRYSLIIAFSAAIVNLVIGVIYGGIAGFAGGKVDNFMMRICDIIYSIPMMIYVILLMIILNPPGSDNNEIVIMVFAISISYWIPMARVVRGEIMQLKQQEFVLAAKALGASRRRILFKHLIPNSLGPIVVTSAMLIPQAIFTEAFLSYIGLGLSAPLASLGTLAKDAQETLSVAPWQMLEPAIFICLIILSFNLLSDGLRDALDPKMKR